MVTGRPHGRESAACEAHLRLVRNLDSCQSLLQILLVSAVLMSGRYLPPELWSLVITNLPSSDKRICLSVSHVLHDLALPLVFAHLTLRFGVLGYDRLKGSVEALELRRARRNESLICHISGTRSFATLVKNLTIECYSSTYCNTRICMVYT